MKNLLTLAFILATTLLLAQSENDKKIFLDSLWKETTEGNHKYYRIIKDYALEKNEYTVFDYYKSGVLQMEGVYKDKLATIQKGKFVYFYENGNKKHQYDPIKEDNSVSKTAHYYENGNIEFEIFTNELKKSGDIFRYYQNGNKKTVEEFNFSRAPKKPTNRILHFWDTNNHQLVINGNGDYLVDDSEEIISGKVKDGNKIGEWIRIDKITHSKNIENYDNDGTFIKGVNIEDDGAKFEYTEFESMPKPKKGMQDFVSYLIEHLKQTNQNKIISGRVVIEFTVDKDGSLGEFKFIKSIAPELDKKIIKILSQYEKWIPGFQNGKNIRAKYTLPLNFNLK